MKQIFLTLLWISLGITGEITDFKTLQARFEQTVTNDQNQTIRYTGRVWLRKPDLALWQYETPLNKTIYIQGKSVVIVEPDLFQATRFESELSLNILDAWQKSRPLSPGVRVAAVGQSRLKLKHNDSYITEASYRDTLDNEVSIRFYDQTRDPVLKPDLFTPEIPAQFDVISH